MPLSLLFRYRTLRDAVTLPTYINVSDIEDSLPEDYLCCVCYEPLLVALRGTCNHVLCQVCSQKLYRENHMRCPLCRRIGQREDDIFFSNEVRTSVEDLLTFRAMELLQSGFPDLPPEVILSIASQCLHKTTLSLNVMMMRSKLQQLPGHSDHVSTLLRGASLQSEAWRLCTSLNHLHVLSRGNGIGKIAIQGCWFVTFSEITGFLCLRKLFLSSCGDALSFAGIECLPALEELIVEECPVVRVRCTEECQRLRVLEFTRCPSLLSVALPAMREGRLASNEKCHHFPSGAINISACPCFETFETPVAAPTLRVLRIDSAFFSDLAALGDCTALQVLHLGRAELPPDVILVEDARPQSWLDCVKSNVRSTFKALRRAQSRRSARSELVRQEQTEDTVSDSQERLLSEIAVGKLRDISLLTSTTGLTEMNLNSSRVDDLSPLAACAPVLQKLCVYACPLNDLSVLRRAGALTEVDLRYTQVTSIAALENCGHLTTVRLSSTRIADISPLAACVPVLEELTLQWCPVDSIVVLKAATHLRELNLSGTRVRDISDLAACTAALQKLQLCTCDVGDVSVLRSATVLTKVDLRQTAVKDFSQIRREAVVLK